MRINERVKALENKQPPVDGLTILTTFVAPGYQGEELHHICDHDGNEWTRKPGETEQAFTERAESETSANPWGIKSLTGKTLEQHHADN